ncbi:hypothetical protein RHMOL_Rhmol12G0099100 [Rhododendron molle]|uniref:Uncharacterized protein n=1 Tax=Rhododendron molle TaxID=49168 RepID=A0ACC0LGQ7_RHOML|nr:hypothetical protein RHMOL_Rhmol12G0099100 [Rhododendron molle]
MIRAAQCVQNIILRVPSRNQRKKDREGFDLSSYFIEEFNKKTVRINPFRSFFC